VDRAKWLTGTRSAVLVDVPEGELPRVLAWGGAASGDGVAAEVAAAALLPAQTSATVDARVPLDLLPSHARGFQGTPALRGAFLDGTGWAPRFDRIDHRWSPDGLDVVAADGEAGLRVHVEVRLDVHDVLVLRAALTNARGGLGGGDDIPSTFPEATPAIGRPRGRTVGGDDYRLDALRLTLPVPDLAREVATFTGRWLREFHQQRHPWLVGRVERVNVRGRSSHEDPPLLLAGSRGFSDERGEVWALHLGWSGNAELRAERSADGFAFLQAAEHLHPGEIVLGPGETYVTPKVYGVASSSGCNGISDAFHAHVRARPNHPRGPRPVTLNTWEAVYFDHDQDKLAELVEVAGDIGVERFVLDDGWFRGRRHDRAGLGDWYVDPEAHPDGLEPLADHVRERGMEFGLWVEPEMVNPDSDLYRADPTVALARPGSPTTRNQHVLDVARQDIGAYLRERLHALVDETGATYLKWDLNRDHVVAERDGVAATHAHVEAAYELLEDIVRAHPGLEIESCSGGGGRVDLGVLQHTHRVWTSDCNDPVERVVIQRGASILLPPELLGCHVGGPIAHTTGRTTSLPMRLATAFFGHLGIEWDITTTHAGERDHLRGAVELYRRWRDVLHTGRVVRVDHPDEHALVHGVVTADRALLFYAQLTTGPWTRPATVRCPGLVPDRPYRVEKVDLLTDWPGFHREAPGWYADGAVTLTGQHLADHGIALQVHQPGTSTVLAITVADA
jgi:alpha-galactosidase